MTPTSVTLDPTQSQVFSCTIATPSTAQVVDIVGTGHGTSPIGDVTFCGATPPANTVCDARERATARAVTIEPDTELNASASPTSAHAGDDITFTITEENTGVAPAGYESYLALTSNSVTASSTTAPGVATDCNLDLGSPTSGDTANAGVLDSGETWTYQCTVTAASVDFSVTFNGSGTVLAGTSHALTVDKTNSDEESSASVDIISPNTQVTVTANAVITYTFKEANTGDTALTPPTAGTRPSVITTSGTPLGMCNVTAVSFVSGDPDNDKILDPGETWVFSCQGSLAGPTTDTGSRSQASAGVGHGKDLTGDDVTKCSPTCTSSQFNIPGERDSLSVTITNNARG
jgi:hypothetical protein